MLLPTIIHGKYVMICKICIENLKLYWSLAQKSGTWSRCAQSNPSLLSLRLDHHYHHQNHDDPHLTTTTSHDYRWLHSSKWYSIRSPTGDLPSLRLELPTREESASPARYKKKPFGIVICFSQHLYFIALLLLCFYFCFDWWTTGSEYQIKNNCLTNTLPPREQSESPGPQSPDRYYSNFQHLDKNTHVIIIFCHHLAWLLIKSSITPKQAFLLFKSQSPSPSPTLRAGLITRLF